MKFSQREIDGIVVLDLKGKMTGGPEAESFRELFKALVKEDKKNIVINLKDVDWISSTGIGILMRAYKTIREVDGEFILVHVGERTQQIFNVMELYRIFKIVDTEEDALKQLSAS